MWPANGLSPQPKHQLPWRRWPLAGLVAAAVQGVCGSREAGGRTDGRVKDKQRDHSTPHFCQGRGPIDEHTTNQCCWVFFGNVIFSIRMLTTAPLIVHIQLPVLGGTQGLRKCKIKKIWTVIDPASCIII